ncbi:hypothetical protein GCM10010266_30010 [Streptomyces griseomycini]|nr:hypothetical protein GCM10010266_30010 [Streptomyces griseomycini]
MKEASSAGRKATSGASRKTTGGATSSTVPVRPGGVSRTPAPYEAVPPQEAVRWHPVHTHDAAHTWLRETAARGPAIRLAGRDRGTR